MTWHKDKLFQYHNINYVKNALTSVRKLKRINDHVVHKSSLIIFINFTNFTNFMNIAKKTKSILHGKNGFAKVSKNLARYRSKNN